MFANFAISLFLIHNPDIHMASVYMKTYVLMLLHFDFPSSKTRTDIHTALYESSLMCPNVLWLCTDFAAEKGGLVLGSSCARDFEHLRAEHSAELIIVLSKDFGKTLLPTFFPHLSSTSNFSCQFCHFTRTTL